MIDLIKGKEIIVVGIARSGLAAVDLLAGAGAARITVTDSKVAADLKDELAVMSRYPAVNIISGENPPELVEANTSFIIKSPGVPPELEIFSRARELGVPVLSEIELAYAFIKAPLVGITGTNGKTTTTSLVTAMLKEARLEPVISAGNIGNSLSAVTHKITAQGLIVCELSSFQLDNIRSFRPTVALFINFAENHLDYHGSVDSYFKAKRRIFENQHSGDYAVLNAADKMVAGLQKEIKAKVIWFDRAPVNVGAGVDQDRIAIFKPGSEPVPICSLAEVLLPGEHNLENALAAAAAAWAAGADPSSIGTVLRSFKAIEHRLEHVATLNGVDYINDSKGTNPGATVTALKAFSGRPIILIAGGKERGGDFSELFAMINSQVRLLLLIGESGTRIASSMEEKGYRHFRILNSLSEAVETAWQEAQSDDIVMLSPACASWDMYRDYEERGRDFKKNVFALRDRGSARREKENGKK